MSGEIEVGHCDICKTPRVHIGRKYYRYDIKCTCCNGKDDDHFEIVYYCKNCENYLFPGEREDGLCEECKGNND